jgi:hypothetical protein
VHACKDKMLIASRTTPYFSLNILSPHFFYPLTTNHYGHGLVTPSGKYNTSGGTTVHEEVPTFLH